MHHSRAHNFNPAAVPADAAAVAATGIAGAGETVNGHIHAGLDKGEVVAAETDFAVSAKETAGEFVQSAFQVGEGNAGVHGQALDLVEVPFVGGVGGFVAVALAGYHYAHRGLGIFHYPGLHRRGVSAEEHGLAAGGVSVVHPEGVPHIPGGMALGDVQALEVVVIPLDFGAFDDAETHSDESVGDFAHHAGGQVEAAGGDGTAGEGDIEALPVGGGG